MPPTPRPELCPQDPHVEGNSCTLSLTTTHTAWHVFPAPTFFFLKFREEKKQEEEGRGRGEADGPP